MRALKRARPFGFWPLFALLIVAGIALFVWLASRQPHFVHRLPDGSVLHLASVCFGEKLTADVRDLWEKALFKVLGTNLPARFSPPGNYWPSFYPGGSAGLVFVRSFDNGGSAHQPELSLVQEDGQERFCDKRTALGPGVVPGRIPPAFPAGSSATWFHVSPKRFGKKSNTAADELIVWEVPPSSAKRLHLRLYETRHQSNWVDFWVHNPLLASTPARAATE